MTKFLIQVTILGDGSRTVAQVTGAPPYDLACRGLGSASREPGDKPDEAIGEKLAAARALHSAARRLERQALGRMRQNENVAAHRAAIAARKADLAPDLFFAHDEAERYRQQSEEAARYPDPDQDCCIRSDSGALVPARIVPWADELVALTPQQAAEECGCKLPRLHDTDLARKSLSFARRPKGKHRKTARD